MTLRQIVKAIVPSPLRRLGWRSYYGIRTKWLTTVVGSQTQNKVVALTFDDGPLPDSTLQILSVLSQFGIKATFFCLGRNVLAEPDLTRQIVRAGHAVGNHTFTHPRLADCRPAMVAHELFRCRQAIRNATGITPHIMRPPYGDQSTISYLVARLMGYAVVNWAVSGDDWQGDPANVIADRILADVRPGNVILMHDGWEPSFREHERRPDEDGLRDRTPTIQALPKIITTLQSAGYEFVTVPEMLRMARTLERAWFVV